MISTLFRVANQVLENNCGTHVCERYNFELFTQGFLSSVKRVIVAFKVGDLGCFYLFLLFFFLGQLVVILNHEN